MESPKQSHLVVHFGVAAGRECFSLENRAKNIMDFRCADERGNTPTNLAISEAQNID
jgi:pyrrolidone-carboxylate peptidase